MGPKQTGAQIQKDVRKSEVNKSMQKRTRPPGYARRVGGYGGRPLLRLNHIFSSRFRLVFISAAPKSAPKSGFGFGCLLPPFFWPVVLLHVFYSTAFDSFYRVLFVGPVIVSEIIISIIKHVLRKG